MCILIHSSQARSKYTLYIDEVKAAKAQDIQKRKVTDAEEAYVQAKKKLKTLEDEANSCLTEADKKAKSALKNHDFKLLAQSVALRDKGTAMLQKEVGDQRCIVHELQSKLVQ